MAISANSIIHYSDTFDVLESVLRNKGLRISYCKEKVITRGGQNYSFAIPMVSFCDIPISDYKKHFYKQKGNNLGYYGDYGIGLTKKWATKNGLNPVLYIDSNSFTGTALRKSVEYITKAEKEDKNLSKKLSVSNRDLDEILQFALYAKNYQGELWRKGKLEQKKYRFYDEREWRFVPNQGEINNHEILLEIGEYESNIDYYKNELIDCYLKFSIEDISYIIVKDDSEITLIVAVLKEIVNGDENLLNVLIAKIISSEQILSDF